MKKTYCRDVYVISIDELDYGQIFTYYWNNPEKRGNAFCIVGKDGCYIGIIAWPDIKRCMDSEELEYCARQNKGRLDKESVSKICQNYQCGEKRYKASVIVEEEVEDTKKDIQDNYMEILEWLTHQGEGINVLRVSIPSRGNPEQEKEKQVFSISMLDRAFYSDAFQLVIAPVLSKISSYSYEEIWKKHKEEKPVYRSEVPEYRIFLIGPCIVVGSNTPNDSVRCSLWRKLKKEGIETEIIPIIAFRTSSEAMFEIKKYDLTNRDLVILIEQEKYFGKMGIEDIDAASVFNNYRGDKWLYYDNPMHVTEFGVDLLTNEMMSKIIPILERNRDIEEKVLFRAEKEKTEPSQQEQIDEFVNGCQKEIEKYGKLENIGAIVMNANPFTKGHRYLVESAAEQVQLLIVFVVEEDESYVPFQHRARLVREGTQDLENVLIMSSGHFIISKSTFRNYFEKETIQSSKIDASKDIDIFGEQIARALHITKRFVGEEPIDQVTKQYNEQMKAKLSAYGVEVIEIPRIKVEKDVISASRVRQLLDEEAWEEISRYVPDATYEYLKGNKGFLKKREYCRDLIKKQMEKKELITVDKMNNFPELLHFISLNEKVAVYGIGLDALLLIKELPEKDKDRIQFFDKKADTEQVVFFGQEVIAPRKLLTEYADYGIIVASREFGMEIYSSLRKQGIAYDRIICMM